MKRLILSATALCLLAACGDGADPEATVSDSGPSGETPAGEPTTERDAPREDALGSDASPGRPDFQPGSTRKADTQADFTAIGQEPGWLLELTAGQDVTIDWQYATRSASFPFERPADMEGPLDLSLQSGEDSLELTVVREDCSDPMSGSDYAYSVTAVINGERLQGCGEWLTE
ncbi:hypothetical protein [Aquisalinus flavus]|uniref:Lipoprotein n=1 Tax=Aquisalinus flavus TaxID=1526572 RepID=A0A8J2V1V9_9PROT|nr:hypothetical protein [Aquisalinus flavus]MBD0426795.1 hypothetical protein [Aquisalinus flavus]UNE46646.1 hypothetical protein FF099_00525 [Aquisalinus flavus]GGC96067.1 hypothetical protein GCM10011342_01070 [Aquisalinus flavus]